MLPACRFSPVSSATTKSRQAKSITLCALPLPRPETPTSGRPVITHPASRHEIPANGSAIPAKSGIRYFRVFSSNPGNSQRPQTIRHNPGRNGSSWYISGAPDPRWNNDVLNELGQVAGFNFEAVDVSPSWSARIPRLEKLPPPANLHLISQY